MRLSACRFLENKRFFVCFPKNRLQKKQAVGKGVLTLGLYVGRLEQEPNSRRFWRLNSIMGLRSGFRSESEAHDPEDLAAIRANTAELRELEARESAVRDCAARMFNLPQASPVRNLAKTHEQKRLDALEMEATRFAAHLSSVTLREGNSGGRLQRLQAVADRANRRADRRYQASLENYPI